MKSFAILGATALSMASMASAFVSPIHPIGTDSWTPGKNVTISWQDDNTAPKLSTNPIFDIFLMTGGDQSQLELATIASDVNGGKTLSIEYTVPYVSPPGQIYFLFFKQKDGTGMSWATRFTITDASGNPGTLKPTLVDGKPNTNPGGIGSIVPSPTAQATPTANTTATGSSGTADPKATGAGKSGATTLGGVSAVASAIVAGAVALFAF